VVVEKLYFRNGWLDSYNWEGLLSYLQLNLQPTLFTMTLAYWP